jgi:N-succinyldiaminopimelate aminotransferase
VSGGPFQPAVARALRLPDDYFEAFTADMRAKRDVLVAGLAAAGLTVYQPQGTYFVTTDITPLGFDDGLEFCRRLPELCGVVAVPEKVFFDDTPESQKIGRPLVRFAFCKRVDVLSEAADRLATLR